MSTEFDKKMRGAKKRNTKMKNDILNAKIKIFNLMNSWDFSKSVIGDDGAKALAEALETNKTLTGLDLAYNNIGDSGAKALAEALETNTTLTTLGLTFNDISKSLMNQIQQKINRNTELKNGK